LFRQDRIWENTRSRFAAAGIGITGYLESYAACSYYQKQDALDKRDNAPWFPGVLDDAVHCEPPYIMIEFAGLMFPVAFSIRRKLAVL
jgi:hypothetical protein